MTTRLKLTIRYKNGNIIDQLVKYARIEDGAISYVMDQQVHGAYQTPVRIPLENVEKIDVGTVECDGWTEVER